MNIIGEGGKERSQSLTSRAVAKMNADGDGPLGPGATSDENRAPFCSAHSHRRQPLRCGSGCFGALSGDFACKNGRAREGTLYENNNKIPAGRGQIT